MKISKLPLEGSMLPFYQQQGWGRLGKGEVEEGEGWGRLGKGRLGKGEVGEGGGLVRLGKGEDGEVQMSWWTNDG